MYITGPSNVWSEECQFVEETTKPPNIDAGRENKAEPGVLD
jgi:hypothetical protein